MSSCSVLNKLLVPAFLFHVTCTTPISANPYKIKLRYLNVPVLKLPVQTTCIYKDHSVLEKTLLTEDDENSVCKTALETLRTPLTTAKDGAKVLTIRDQTKRDFDPKITDVIIPEINRIKTHEMVKERFPQIKILFTSRYSKEQITCNGKFADKIKFLPKPHLSKKIREILDKQIT
ncbi:MAG: hypothetical protein DRP91_01705 [Candidatus Neomarinimicrobiota bacterium]|nr:MAG: hypothetical protein DRP91_01705 [Candidatus Neomarinimicrobiota bacterium]